MVTLAGINIGNVVKIAPVPNDINDLCKAIMIEKKTALNYCDADNLIVFPPGTTNYDDKTNAYKRGCKDFPKVDDEDCPLIVVAPQNESGTCVVAFLFCFLLSSPLL